MPDTRFQHVVKGQSPNGNVVFWTAMEGRCPAFLRSRELAYPLSLEGAREIATRFNVGPVTAGRV